MQIIDAIARVMWLLVGAIMLGAFLAFVVAWLLDEARHRKVRKQAEMAREVRKQVNEILARLEGDEGAWV